MWLGRGKLLLIGMIRSGVMFVMNYRYYVAGGNGMPKRGMEVGRGYVAGWRNK